ncbi:amidoligase family protein [Aliidiomarina maris]|uniref:Alpha-L-fucosidase n=1 Tax=Aliidiomarina maris TaxID=531312 RepID=A0A327X2J1_9GAMM|nr:amidoligase family protein [Aliidiomarina maris]MBA3988314.1 alpha-L-fucosidase [Idiomarina sp.]MCL5049486.1 amidoligase family protein [Bacillota bacterium]RAJ96882.1 putative amidoligase enzyme [Aliidiomarina maris]RUO24179.1 alpha-L-fucosidase [Aliidiomarina maris]
MSAEHRIHMPQLLTNADGNARRIGVEMEMSGLSIDQLSTIVADFFNLKVEPTSRYQYTLKGDDDGEWLTELDFRLLKEMGEKEHQGHKKDIESLLELVSKPLVPHELVSPPLDMRRLDEVQALIETLRKAGAKGTSDSVLYAFSMQLNPELPSLDVDTITRYLKAFLCLYDWLHDEASINFTRRITTYVDPFPTKYVKKVLAEDYWPTSNDELIRDYLTDNPTRNRALDLLPLFAFINEELVQEFTQDPLIKARPAFHYRLPNCEIHLPDWGIHLAWNGWLQVEALAQDKARLRQCAKQWQKNEQRPWWQHVLRPRKSDWSREVRKQWLIHLEDM